MKPWAPKKRAPRWQPRVEVRPAVVEDEEQREVETR